MSGFFVLVHKEWTEWMRTRRLPVLLVVYTLVGLGSPLVAKALPAILAKMPEDQMGGVEVLMISAPGVTEAMAQYLKNFGLLTLVALLAGVGAIASERSRGIAAMVLCKPVSRASWTLSKVIVPLGLHTVGTAIAALCAWAYTLALFGEIDLSAYLLLNLLLLESLWCWTSVSLAVSAWSPSAGVAAGASVAVYLVFSLVGAIPVVGRFMPSGLVAAAGGLVKGTALVGLPGTVAAGAVVIGISLLAALRGVARMQP